MQAVAECLNKFFAPVELPDIGDWHHYAEEEVCARYRTVKRRDPQTNEWKTYFLYRWPNYRGQGYEASLLKHCPTEYVAELLTLTIGEYQIPHVSEDLVYYMALHDLNWINEAGRHDNEILDAIDTWEWSQNFVQTE